VLYLFAHPLDAAIIMGVKRSAWNFFSNHALVLFYLNRSPKQTLREVAIAMGMTERAVQRIVAELEADGYLERSKEGRQNVYSIKIEKHLRHPLEAHRTVEELLDWWVEPEALEDELDAYKALENWTVGEHGSEV